MAEVNGGQQGPLTIKLQKWGEVKGRMLDDNGEPLANLQLASLGRPQEGEKPGRLPRMHSTDDQGRFPYRWTRPGLDLSLAVAR